jgi:GAF domain-containing protein
MTDRSLHDAVAAGVLVARQEHGELLQSIVDVARAILGARASSIMLYDAEADELVFEAVSGEGAGTLVGRRMPSSTGIAGWVLSARQPLVIEDVSQDPRFARDVAEGTGYVPKGLIAVPLLHAERTLGVLSVLDRPQRSQFSLMEMDLLGLFASQAAIALALFEAARRTQALLEETPTDITALARVAAALEALEGPARENGVRLLDALAEILAGAP